ncbi:MAG: hypothetical protein ACLRZ9_00285 [Eubacterium sp.]
MKKIMENAAISFSSEIALVRIIAKFEVNMSIEHIHITIICFLDNILLFRTILFMTIIININIDLLNSVQITLVILCSFKR